MERTRAKLSKEDVRRRTAKREVNLVLSILTGKKSTKKESRRDWITVAEIGDWKKTFLLDGKGNH